MMNVLLHLWKKIVAATRKLGEANAQSCGRCGICHHVCSFLNSKSPAKAREE